MARDVPAAAAAARGLELPPGITVLVGENGSGKSTVVEMMAEAYGLNPQGGSILARPAAPGAATEPVRATGCSSSAARPAGRRGRTSCGPTRCTRSTRTWRSTPAGAARAVHELSHGQGFLEILRTRVNQRGFYLMDEPDAPLSFVSCLSLVARCTTWPPPGLSW